MMKAWHPAGPFDGERFELSKEHKERLLAIIDRTQDQAEPFIQAVEVAISDSISYAKQRESSKPSKVRRNLQRAAKLAKELVDCLNKFDGLSRQMLSEVPDGIGFRQALLNASSVYVTTQNATVLAEDFPQRGSLYQGHKILLAYGIASAIQDILGIRPTLTHAEPSGIYARCLRVAIEAAHFSHEDLFGLMQKGREALDSRVQEQEGGVTYFTLR